MKKIIIISGAPATGKSTLAKELSKEFNCPWISGDFIRNWLQSVLEKDIESNLFIFKGTAKEHYKKHSIQETMDMEYKRDLEVFKGIKSFIKNNADWDFYIMEGISFHPKFISELDFNDIEIIPIFLIDKDEDRIKYVLETRGLWGKDPEIKEVEADYIKQTNKYYQEEVLKYNFKSFILDKDRKITINKIKEYLKGKKN